MPWHRDSITQGEIEALIESARQAWSEDTRYPLAAGGGDSGQCYVTACWLRSRLGGRVARKEGHYVWLSPDGGYVIDLAPHDGTRGYYHTAKLQGYKVVEGEPNSRALRFIARANDIFDNLDQLLKVADLVGDSHPAEEPQRENDRHKTEPYWHDEPDYEPAEGEYNFVYGNGQLEVSPFHKHDELMGHTGIHPNHRGPMAIGYVTVRNGKATWEVDGNMNLKGLQRIFKDYSKHVGWDWGGLAHIDGEPVSDDFAPKKGKTLNYVYDEKSDHLWIGSTPLSELALRSGGISDERSLYGGELRVEGQSAFAYGSIRAQGGVSALYDYCGDNGLVLYAGNDNVTDVIPDLEVDNLGADKEDFDKPPVDEREPSGVYKCPVCDRLFPGWYEYQRHRKEEAEDYGDEMEQNGKFPDLPDMDDTNPAHFTEMQPAIMPVAFTEANRVDCFLSREYPSTRHNPDVTTNFVAYHKGSPVGWAAMVNRTGTIASVYGVNVAPGYEWVEPLIRHKIQRVSGKDPKDLLEAPMPFIYDVQEDQIQVGEPGKRTSDIPGKFTPGGIVEGVYEPGGKVVLRTMTSMPYTVRHLIQLWYYTHPELEVKSVHLQDDAGGNTKLAADEANVAGTIQSLVAADPVAHTAYKALEAAGGNVFVVGGAVRDVVAGKDPNDLDLMVQGLDGKDVGRILDELPGQTKMTGKDFGVFRYNEHGGNEVEIALPRKERSTGAGHKDFEVQHDPNMKPEEDLFRRDFTANALAVDLGTGQLLDPYHGVQDIEKGILRTHNPDALGEDPLRVVRALVANAKHGLVPDETTMKQMKDAAPSLEHLPGERIQAELDKLFLADGPHNAMRLANKAGVIPHIFPEAHKCFGFDQNNPHHELELGEHLLKVLERTAEKTKDPDVRLAAFLHDIGKPDSAWVDPEKGTNHYYEKRMPDGTILGKMHEDVGAEQARNIMTRLRYPTDRTQRVSELIKHHMWAPFTTQRGARRFINRVRHHADDLFDLRWADQGGKNEHPMDPTTSLDMQRNLVERVRNSGEATDKGSLAIDGNDLIAAGIPAGPQMGQIFQQLTEAVVDDPRLNNKETLLNMARGYGTITT